MHNANELDATLLELIRTQLIGVESGKGREILEKFKIPHRTVFIDGQPMIITRDVVMNRINLTIVDDIITEAHFG